MQLKFQPLAFSGVGELDAGQLDFDEVELAALDAFLYAPGGKPLEPGALTKLSPGEPRQQPAAEAPGPSDRPLEQSALTAPDHCLHVDEGHSQPCSMCVQRSPSQ